MGSILYTRDQTRTPDGGMGFWRVQVWVRCPYPGVDPCQALVIASGTTLPWWYSLNKFVPHATNAAWVAWSHKHCCGWVEHLDASGKVREVAVTAQCWIQTNFFINEMCDEGWKCRNPQFDSKCKGSFWPVMSSWGWLVGCRVQSWDGIHLVYETAAHLIVPAQCWESWYFLFRYSYPDTRF